MADLGHEEDDVGDIGEEEVDEKEFAGLSPAPSGDGKKPEGAGGESGYGPKLSESLLGSVFSQAHMASALAALSQPGKDARHLSMRANVRDWNHVNAAARHWAKCRHFKDKESEEELLMHLALDVSIEGRSRTEIVQAIIGAYQPSMFGGDQKGLASHLRKFLRLGGESKAED